MLRERQTILANARKNIIENEWHEKPVIDEKDTDVWKMRVAEAVSLLKEKVAEKVVLAREIQLDFKNKIHPVAVLQRLSEQQKGSYLFSLKFDEDCFIGATPERLVRKEGMELFSAGVAGSSPRGKTAIEDEQIKQALLRDRKNLDEHQFVVDMILDAFSQVTEFIDKAESPTILTIKDIHHLYTPIKGIIQEDVSIFDVVKLLHPTPALGGTPKDTALQLIPELELFDRGLYAAPIGWVDYQMDGEFVVGIRSALLKEKQALLFAGCGIVRESDPEEEFLETCVKLRPMLRALGGTEDE